MILLRRIVKAHVSAYDRVSKTGALSHIREHEDSRVRSYARKILGSKNSYDLYTIKRDRFGHLPHWNKLNEHTRQAVLDAEEEKTRGHRDFEEWVEKHGSKKGTKKDAEKVDRSGWEQQMMFKGIRHNRLLIRKSQMAFDFNGASHDHHVAYTRTSASGTVSQIQAKGVQHKIEAYHPETQKIVLDTYTKLLQDFPHPHLPITIGTTEGKGVLGEASLHYDGMSLTPEWSGRQPDEIQQGTTTRPAWLTAHEFAHVVDGILQNTTRDGKAYDKYMRTIGKIRSEHKKNDRAITAYSLTNRNEWLAEHFADAAINGDKAMPASRKLYQTLKELYAAHPYKSHQQLRDAMKQEREARMQKSVQHVAYILRKSDVHGGRRENSAGTVWQQRDYTNKVVAKAKAEKLLTAPNGTLDFGVFHQEASDSTGYPPRAIRLQVGEHNDKTGKGYGKVHIKSRHWKNEIRPAGYVSVLAFVEDVATNFDAVYQVDKGRLALVKEDGNLAAIVEIEKKDGEEFYKVITAYVANKNKFAGQEPLWRRSQSSHPETGDQEPSELEQVKSVEVPESQRYPTSTDDQSGAVETNISSPKNEINKSHNPLYLFRRRGC